jgi:predicted metal-dependent hydrolase
VNTPQDDGFSYEVIRTNRSTADIIIERDGSVVVRAPEWADDDQVANIVESKHYWIYKGLAEWRDLNTTGILREYKNGEGFLYLGRSYRLSLISDQDDALQLKDGRFVLRRDLVELGEISVAKEAFRGFYIAKGLKRLEARVAYFAPKVGAEPTGVDVRDLGHRWASCSPSFKLAFHWKCMMAPQSIIDYIVVHELCHIHHRDHTDAFWNEVDKVLPDFRERKEWLRKNGAGLNI